MRRVPGVAGRNGVIPRGPIERLLHLVKLNPETSCLEWTGALDAKGYARIAVGGKRNRPAHRVAYEARFGPIPDGLTIDHLCRNKHCCNPDHMEPVTAAENTRRANDFRGPQTHCRRGHLFSPENEVMNPRGRTCRECKRTRERATKAAKRSNAHAG